MTEVTQLKRKDVCDFAVLISMESCTRSDMNVLRGNE